MRVREGGDYDNGWRVAAVRCVFLVVLLGFEDGSDTLTETPFSLRFSPEPTPPRRAAR